MWSAVKISAWLFTTEKNGREDGKQRKKARKCRICVLNGLWTFAQFFVYRATARSNKKGVHLITYITFHYDGYCSCRVGKISFFCFLMDMVMFADFFFR